MIKKAVKKPGGAAVKKSLKKAVRVKPASVVEVSSVANLADMPFSQPVAAAPDYDAAPDGVAPVAKPRWTTFDTFIVIAGLALGGVALYFFS